MPKIDKVARATEARESLLGWIGDRQIRELYVTVVSVNREGTSRAIAVYLPTDDNGHLGILDASGKVADLLDLRRGHQDRGVRVHGGGMDMGFHLVSSVSRALYGDDYAINHRWLS